AIAILYGAGPGLVAGGSKFATEGSLKVLHGSQAGERFGSALAVGDFDNSGHDQVVIGSPFESIGGKSGAGAVTVGKGDLSVRKTWSEATLGVIGGPNAGETLGRARGGGDMEGNRG